MPTALLLCVSTSGCHCSSSPGRLHIWIEHRPFPHSGAGAAPPPFNHAAAEEGPTAGRPLFAPSGAAAAALSPFDHRQPASRPTQRGRPPSSSPSPPLRRRSCPPGDARSRLRATMVTVWRGARGDVGPLMGLLRLCVVIRTRPRTRAQGMVGLQVFHGAVSGLFRLPFLPFQAQLPCFKEILQLAGKKSFGSFKNHWIDKAYWESKDAFLPGRCTMRTLQMEMVRAAGTWEYRD